jgi:hypothetical protein
MTSKKIVLTAATCRKTNIGIVA